MPTPNKGEKKDKFLSRCMKYMNDNKEFGDNKQRYAVCNSLWTKHANKKSSKGQDMIAKAIEHLSDKNA